MGKHTEKSVKRKIDVAYDRYITGLFKEDDRGKPSKKFRKAVKANKWDKVGVTSLKSENGELITTSKEKAGILSFQEQMVVVDEDVTNILSKETNPYLTMADIIVTTKGVEAY